MTHSAELLFEVKGAIATLTLNRPEALNSFTKHMAHEFSRLWTLISDDDAIHAVVLRAAPGRAFSTGLDMKAVTREGGSLLHSNVWSAADPGELLGPKSNHCWKPVVTAVHGMAAGGAFYWLNESDIIICSDDATFFDPHVTYGMTAALEPIGATYRMPLGDVLRMTLLGNDERISAQTALRMGLVSEVTSLETLWTRADELAQIIARKPPAAIQGSLKAIWSSLDLPRSAALASGMTYCQVGNPIGMAQVDRNRVMSDNAKRFTVR